MSDENAPARPHGAEDLGDPERPGWPWRGLRVVCRLIVAPLMRYDVRGAERLPDGPALLLANHQSYLDPILIGMPGSRPVAFVARHGLFNVPLLSGIMRANYAMPINQQSAASSIRVPISRLQAGFYVALFPEGERTPTGELLPLKPGFSALLRRANVPIVPVGISGAYEAWPRHRKLPRPGKVRVVFGEAFEVGDLAERGREAELLAHVSEKIRAVIDEADEWRNS